MERYSVISEEVYPTDLAIAMNIINPVSFESSVCGSVRSGFLPCIFNMMQFFFISCSIVISCIWEYLVCFQIGIQFLFLRLSQILSASRR